MPKNSEKPVCALLNNKIASLNTRVFRCSQIEFVYQDSEYGRKVYMQSLCFVLWKAVEDLYGVRTLLLEAPVSKGYYFTLDLDRQFTLEDVASLKARMVEIIQSGIPFRHHEAPTDEVIALFRKHGLEKKAKLIEGRGRLYSDFYTLDSTIDSYYGPLVPDTSFLGLFDLVKYYDGMLLRVPREGGKLPEIEKQEKLLNAFRRDHEIEKRLGVSTVGDLNNANAKGYAGDIIKIAEALQEKHISRIADQIAERGKVKVVLISGPSSSGKTTFSKRLSVQLLTSGLRPYALSLDDYFLDRDKTPIDEYGEYDYESIYALNLPLFQQHFRQLLNGEEVELPRYDFPTGKNVSSGKRLQLQDNMILVIEGIHALNPMLIEGVPADNIFKVYVSALTTIKLDRHNYIPTTDSRLIRRIVRDSKYRGTTAEQTIARWPSVRRGEDKWIFPYQENADVMFNSALLYEIAVLRNHIMPLLDNVPQNKKEYTKACMLRQFLSYFMPISDTELPPTSLLREFLGGSSFRY